MKKAMVVAVAAVIFVGLATLATAGEPRLIKPDGSAQELTVGSGPIPLVRLNGEGALELNLPESPILVVTVRADNPLYMYGAKLLTGSVTHADVMQAGDDLVAAFPVALPLESPEGGPFSSQDGQAKVVEFSAQWPFATVAGKTFRKVCDPGCAPWPQDLTCCTILGCSGPYKDCIEIQY
jgi:hypothetical protein